MGKPLRFQCPFIIIKWREPNQEHRRQQWDIFKILLLFKYRLNKILVMKMAERVDEIDYEPDVLKFRQIWDQMKETSKDGKNMKRTGELGVDSVSKSKNAGHPKNNESTKQSKKQTVMSVKNVTRNPKRDQEQVVQVVTRSAGIQQEESLKNQRQFVNRQDYVVSANGSTLQNQLDNMKRTLDQKDCQISLLRVSNTRNQDRIRILENQIAKRDEKISQLQGRERQLLSHNNELTGNEKVFDYGQVEYENFRNDTRRLLKMLQTTSEYQQFSNLALDDNGVRFLNSVNKNVKTHIDSKEKTRLHFCTCNKDFIPESGFWVPQKVYSYSKQFIKQRKGEMTNAELELLLYDLNKIWREREKRIINSLNSQRAKQVEKLKRKMA